MSTGSILKDGVRIYDDRLLLRVSADRQNAVLHPVNEEDQAIRSFDLERLRREATELGITYGLLSDPESLGDGSFLLARGQPPVHGENARIKLHVKPSIAHVPRQQQPGQDRVDYRELGTIVNVVQDQFLLEKIPLTDGISGTDVLGSILAPKPGKDLKIKLGPGVRISEDEMRVYATLNGKFVMVDGRACVFGEHTIQGDVDLSVGNVVFAGALLTIQGEVLPGFKVRCPGGVIVRGGINNAEVLAGGRLEVGGSVLGEQALVRSKGDMVLGFVENGPQIETLGHLRIEDFIVQARVRVNGDMTVIEGNGTIVGGACVVGGSIFVRELGSDGEVVTELSVGINPGFELRREKLNEALKVWPERLNEVIKNIGSLQQLRKKEGRLSPEKEELLKRFSAAMPKLAEKVNRLSELEQQLNVEKENMTNEAIYVYGRVHPGVTVRIGSAIRTINVEEEAVTIRFDPLTRQIVLRKMTNDERQQMGRK